jgi:hypothetical protein
LSRSDDEIDEELDLRLTYRQGWPKLPLLPLDLRRPSTHAANEHLPDLNRHFKIIGQILRAQSLAFDDMAFCHRVHPRSEPDKTTATFIVTFTESSPQWRHAIRLIWKHFAKEIINIPIEFITKAAL